MRKLSLTFILAAFVLLCFTWSVFAIEEGDMLPDFMAKDLKGNDVKISDFRGGYTLYDVWATWCGPCKKAMKSYQQNIKRFENAGIKIVAISVDAKVDEPIAWMEKEKAPFIVIHDANKQTKPLWGVTGIPTVFLVDPSGKILVKEIGFDDFAGLWESITSKVKVKDINDFVYPKIKPAAYSAEPTKVDFGTLGTNLTISFMTEEEKDFTKTSELKLAKEPKYENTPLYGTIRIGKKAFTMAAVDSKKTGFMDKLYVDFNGNLDLTDDGNPLDVPKGSNYSEIVFPLTVNNITYSIDAYTYMGENKFYMDTATGYQTTLKTVDGKTMKAMLLDTNANGIFTDAGDVLLIDLDRNGIFDSFSAEREWATIGKNLKLGANTYKIEVLVGGKLITIKEVK